MQPEEMPYFVGTVAAIFYQNPSNFYKVLLVRVTETTADYREKEIVVTGSFGDVQENELYRFYGELVDHPKYGRQLKVERYEQESLLQPTVLLVICLVRNFRVSERKQQKKSLSYWVKKRLKKSLLILQC